MNKSRDEIVQLIEELEEAVAARDDKISELLDELNDAKMNQKGEEQLQLFFEAEKRNLQEKLNNAK